MNPCSSIGDNVAHNFLMEELPLVDEPILIVEPVII
jgi:hypothetical protein